jgi:hypothetical protein
MSGLRRTSKKRQTENRVRKRVMLETFGRYPRCAGCGPLAELGIETGCNGWADDAHEILSRARGGSITDPANVIPLGRRCHDYVTTHPREAEAAGLSRSAGPRSIP